MRMELTLDAGAVLTPPISPDMVHVDFSVCYPADLAAGSTFTLVTNGSAAEFPWNAEEELCLGPENAVDPQVGLKPVLFHLRYSEMNVGVETAVGTTAEGAGNVSSLVGWVNTIYLDGVPKESTYARGPLRSGEAAEDMMVLDFGLFLDEGVHTLELVVDAYG